MDTLEGKSWLQVAQDINPDITSKEVEYILWEKTCFPFDNEMALKQFIEFIQSQSK